MRSLNAQQIILQRGFSPQQPLIKHHSDDVFRNAMRQLKSATTSTIPVDDIPIISELLLLDAQTTLTSRPPTTHIANHIERAATF